MINRVWEHGADYVVFEEGRPFGVIIGPSHERYALVKSYLAEHEDALVPEPVPPPPTPEELAARRRAEIMQQLIETDQKTIRPLRAVITGNPSDADRTRLEMLTAYADNLRDQLAELGERT